MKGGLYMTLGEKIVNLRMNIGLSQEELAEKVNVSRQSVSKWEMNQALPQIDKVLMLCELFNVSTDALLLDKNEVKAQSKSENKGLKYFGTDGFRGEANLNLTSLQAYKVGRFLGWYFSSSLSGCDKPNYRPRIVIGKDTRRSSYMIEYSNILHRILNIVFQIVAQTGTVIFALTTPVLLIADSIKKVLGSECWLAPQTGYWHQTLLRTDADRSID